MDWIQQKGFEYSYRVWGDMDIAGTYVHVENFEGIQNKGISAVL